MTQPKTNGVRWSDVVRRIEAGEPVAKVSGEELLHPYGVGLWRSTSPTVAVPALDLDEEPPAPPPARAYDRPSRVDPDGHAAHGCDPVPVPPTRRGWLQMLGLVDPPWEWVGATHPRRRVER